MGLRGQYSHATLGGRSLSLQLAPGGGKELRLNDKPLSERRELLSEVLCICFVQQDMDFVTGTPEDRRRFFDQTLVLSDLSFLDTLRDYRHVLKSRNLCLRENRDDLLDVYDAQLAAPGPRPAGAPRGARPRVRCGLWPAVSRDHRQRYRGEHPLPALVGRASDDR